jgi:hypothetical protein
MIKKNEREFNPILQINRNHEKEQLQIHNDKEIKRGSLAKFKVKG